MQLALVNGPSGHGVSLSAPAVSTSKTLLAPVDHTAMFVSIHHIRTLVPVQRHGYRYGSGDALPKRVFAIRATCRILLNAGQAKMGIAVKLSTAMSSNVSTNPRKRTIIKYDVSLSRYGDGPRSGNQCG